MQLFGKKNVEDPDAFWRTTAEKRGGAIGFITYATLLGRTKDAILDRAGLLYTVGDAVWFEDFERDNWLARMMNGKTAFVKTEITFSLSEVVFTRAVSRSNAMASIAGKKEPASLPVITALGRFLSTPFIMVGLRDGTALFFDAIRRRELLALFQGDAEHPSH
jgi:hypothetical protein